MVCILSTRYTEILLQNYPYRCVSFLTNPFSAGMNMCFPQQLCLHRLKGGLPCSAREIKMKNLKTFQHLSESPRPAHVITLAALLKQVLANPV